MPEWAAARALRSICRCVNGETPAQAGRPQRLPAFQNSQNARNWRSALRSSMFRPKNRWRLPHQTTTACRAKNGLRLLRASLKVPGCTTATAIREAGGLFAASSQIDREACPLNLAPTSSTTTTLALGDALAVACLSAKGFSQEDFARSHPGGALGRRLLLHVRDIMRTGDELPRVTADVRVLDAVREITKKHIGMTAVVDSDNRVIGIFTEGDLRRLIERMGDVRDVMMRDVMTPSPHTISPDELAAAAVKALEAFQCNQLLVVDADNHLVGALHMHDLMNARVL